MGKHEAKGPSTSEQNAGAKSNTSGGQHRPDPSIERRGGTPGDRMLAEQDKQAGR